MQIVGIRYAKSRIAFASQMIYNTRIVRGGKFLDPQPVLSRQRLRADEMELNAVNDEVLEAIIAIADEKSISKAASKLFISQSALSRILQKKEEELEEILFYRTSKGLLPTPSGVFFIEHARKIRKLYEDLDSEFCAVNQLHKGKIVIAAPTRLCSVVLPQPIREFHRRYPNVKFSVHDISGTGTEEEVINAKADIGFIYLPPRCGNMMTAPLFTISSVILVPKDHPANKKAYFSQEIQAYCMALEDIAAYDFILPSLSTNSRRFANRVFNAAGIKPNISIEAVSLDVIISLVAAGDGVSVIPLLNGLFYQKDLAGINVYNLDPRYKIHNTIAAIYNDDAYMTTVAKKFLEIVKETDWEQICPRYFV